MYEILEFISMSFPSWFDDQFDFVFFSSMINHWQGSCKGCAIGLCLLIQKEEVDMEDVMDPHSVWKVQSIGYLSNTFFNCEGAVSLWLELLWSDDWKVLVFQPDLFSHLHLLQLLGILVLLSLFQKLLDFLSHCFKGLESIDCGWHAIINESYVYLGFDPNQEFMRQFPGYVTSPRITVWVYSAIWSSLAQLFCLSVVHGCRYCSTQAFIHSVCLSV